MSIEIQMDIEFADIITDPSSRYAAFEEIAFKKKPSPAEYAHAVAELGKIHLSQKEYFIAQEYFQEAVEKDPTLNVGESALANALHVEDDTDKRVELLYTLLRQRPENSRFPLPYGQTLIYDELVDICVATNKKVFLREIVGWTGLQTSQTIDGTPLTLLEQRIQELERANVGLGITKEMSDPTSYTLPKPDESTYSSAAPRVLARIPFWLKRREWIDLGYRQMYLHAIVTAGKTFSYIPSKEKKVSYAEATFEYAALTNNPFVPTWVNQLLTSKWGKKVFDERYLAICSQDTKKRFRLKNSPSPNDVSPITTVACAHLGQYTDVFPKTTHGRIHYCADELIKLEQRENVPPFWKHIYAQVLTSYVHKIIKEEGLVKL